MKNIYLQRFLLSIFFFLLLGANESFAQDQYFRYFQIDTEQLDSGQLSAIHEELIKHPSMEVFANCPEKHTLLVAVNAKYQKRIDDIKSELVAMTGKLSRNQAPPDVQSVPLAERDSICQ